MSTTWTRIARMLGIAIPTSIAVMAMAGGAAWAQETCPDSTLDPSVLAMPGFKGYMPHAQAVTCTGTYGGCFRVDGSDTLTDVVHNAIVGSAACISYHNVGSGQAEHNMQEDSSATTFQGIGPMSRNFTSAVLSAHSAWAPTAANVLALDAGVWVVKSSTGHCVDLDAALANSSDPSTAQITTDLSIIMSGYSGTDGVQSTGTTTECAHPRRLQALADLTSCQGVNRIDHIYRRDDNSGTQDTFREHLQVKYWCNGQSLGNTNYPGSNLLNEDLDPIRRSCIGSDATKAQTRCTYYPTNITCTAGSADLAVGATGNPYNQAIKCTQGLIVALSENDPGSDDITKSIGNRVANDGNGYTIGLAGLAASEVGNPPNVATNINTVTTQPGNVYIGQYMFSRRLFLMQNPTFGQTGGLQPKAGEVAGRTTEEGKLFTWATTDTCEMQPIVVTAGFLPRMENGCSDSCVSSGEGNILTCLAPSSGVSTPKQHIGAEGEGNTSATNVFPCVANNALLTSAACPVIPSEATNYECNLNAKCLNGTCQYDSSNISGLCN